MRIKDGKNSNDFYDVKSNITDAKFAIKDVDMGSRIVTGFYNAYNFLDHASDVLLDGVCKRSIRERGPKAQSVPKIKHALHHDLTQLPGKILTLEEKEVDGISGLYFETEMMDTTLGNDTLKNYIGEVYDNHSIGYRVVDYKFIERINEKAWNDAVSKLINPKAADGLQYMYLIKEIQLWEGSTVSFGCNELTPFLGMKSEKPEVFILNVMNRILAIEKTLKSGTQSDDMMSTLELQLMQMKQVFHDIFAMVPDEMKQAEKRERKDDIIVPVDYASAIMDMRLT